MPQPTGSPARPDRPEIYSVSRLAGEVKALLESAFPLLWVEGELSNVARPRSGHLYFTLKDDSAQIRCAMFKGRNQLLRFEPREGTQVLARVRIGLYAPRGDFQLIVEHMEPAGDGALRRAFEALRQRLEKEGLFAPERKRPLPSLPRRIGVVTSATGAALRDVLHVLRRRFPALAVLVYPVRVQGEGAGDEIAGMLRRVSARREVDAVLLTRGGGSLEDLWAFNEEVVARAIADCALPVVSAVGHETDVTIADLVADQRAPTPSAGAEMLSPDGAAWQQRFSALERQLVQGMRQRLSRLDRRRDELTRRLHAQHPGRRLQERAQRLDELDARLTAAVRRDLERRRLRLTHAGQRLGGIDPRRRVRALREHLQTQRRRLRVAVRARLTSERQRLSALARTLETVSPLATVGRGYAIVRRAADAAIVRRIDDVAEGERISARLTDGELHCRVEERTPETAAPMPDRTESTLTDSGDR